jgi:peptide/nickel transport system permease protein
VLRIVLRRLLQSIPIGLIVLVGTFILIRVGGGDPTATILGISATAEQRAELRETLGLNDPLFTQLLRYVGEVFTGDFGDSYVSKRPVVAVLLQALPVTLSVTLLAVTVAFIVGIPLGILAARRGGVTDRVIQSSTVLFMAIPGFWLALMLMVGFAVRLRWFPTSGYVAFERDALGWIQHVTLPVVALCSAAVAALCLQTRARFVDIFDQDFIRTLRAAGVPTRSIVFRHALKNAGGTIVTVGGLQFIGLLGGVMFVEQVFALPGIGRIAVQAATQHDFPILQGIVVVLMVLVVITNLVVEIARAAVNPKVRLA